MEKRRLSPMPFFATRPFHLFIAPFFYLASRLRALHPAIVRSIALLALTLPLLATSAGADQGRHFYPLARSELQQGLSPVIGSTVGYTIKKEDTLLDIARKFDLGYNEIRVLYPEMDPWMPPTGSRIDIPRMWILPDFSPNSEPPEVVINLAEMRLFLYDDQRELVRSYPVGIGRARTPTPTGDFRIRHKVKDPDWTVPLELRDKYGISRVPAGDGNPLGGYWLGLDLSGYGIHGTNFAWSVGRASTNGCIRLYPKDISQIFSLLGYRARVRIVYQPVKLGMKDGELLVEVHHDVYNRFDDLAAHAFRMLQTRGLTRQTDMMKLRLALQRQSGKPVSISDAAQRAE